ncbi:MAG TPA: hypothetical protein VFY36_12815 [Solirubrobacteraceae bacterium]|nr:hypothetical protein [Solirubrobacteraceae bacterium]
MLRFLLWRMLGLLSVLLALSLTAWLLGGGPGRVLRGEAKAADGNSDLQLNVDGLARAFERGLGELIRWVPVDGAWRYSPLLLPAGICAVAIASTRWAARHRRRYVRLRIEAYRTDHAEPDVVASVFEALHKRLLRRWWRRLLLGQPSIALEIHHDGAEREQQATPRAPDRISLTVSCPQGLERIVEAAFQGAYPNSRLTPARHQVGNPPTVLRLKKHAQFTKRVFALEFHAREDANSIDRLLTAMGACGEPAFVQFALTPTPASFEALSKRAYKRHEARLSRERREHLIMRDRSMVEDAELRGGLEVQHKPLFFLDLRVIAPDRTTCERIASQLRARSAENRLIERGTSLRHGVFGLYGRRVRRGEGNPIPSFSKGVFASTELAALWQLPSSDYATVPFARTSVPLAPAPPGIFRPAHGMGTLRDAVGPVAIHPEMRNQNVAVLGAVEQGKSSFLVASVAEDLRRERCAVIVLDPKGDVAEAAVSLVPEQRACTLLDLAHPPCGFDPSSSRVDLDRVISEREVLVVKGALGVAGAGRTSMLMRRLVGMLDAALAGQQDLVPERQRVAVALKIDEAPLVIDRLFVETMALRRSAGLETVACWHTDAQWVEREVRDQLDALFAHRVYFATASVRDARLAADVTMTEYSDMVRPGIERLSSLGHPDVRLHLPKHHAIVSWITAAGRQPAFVAQTIPSKTDRERLALHAARQHERGARHLTDERFRARFSSADHPRASVPRPP